MNSFQVCCSKRNPVKFSFDHNPKPIVFSNDMQLALEMLLWYVPNIKSYQSHENPIIKSKDYSDFCFEYIVRKIGLDINKDVCCLDAIDNKLWSFYNKDCCVNCSKIIMVKNDNYSKTENLLRHIRNSIAHGRFVTIKQDLFIGYDVNTSNVLNAIIKVKPKLLLNALYDITRDSISFKLKLYESMFKSFNYSIVYLNEFIDNQKNNIDLVIEKERQRYLIEVKDISFIFDEAKEKKSKKDLYIHNDKMFSLLEYYRNYYSTDTILVLIIDNKIITKETQMLLKESKMLIIDKSIIKKTGFKNDPIAYAMETQWNRIINK